MKGRFLRGISKGIASLMVAAMLFTGNGMTTLAANLSPEEASYTEDGTVLEEDSGSEYEEGEEVPEDASEEQREDAVKKAPGEVSEDAAENTSEEVPEDASENIPEFEEGLTVKDLLDDALLKEMDNQVSENAAEAADEEEVVVTASGSSENGNVRYEVNGSSMTVTIKGDTFIDVYEGGMTACWPWDDEDIAFKKSSITAITVISENDKQTNANVMFSEFKNVTELNLSQMKTANITDMSDMFNGCAALRSITFSDDFKTTNCTNIDRMFEGCKALTSLDLSHFDFSKVTTASDFVKDCNALTNIEAPLNLKIKVDLPKSSTGGTSSKTWYYNGAQQTQFPMNLTSSINITTKASAADTKVTLTVARNIPNGRFEICDTGRKELTGSSSASAELPINSKFIIKAIPESGYVFKTFKSTPAGFSYTSSENDQDYTCVSETVNGVTVVYIQKKAGADKNYTITGSFMEAGALADPITITAAKPEHGTITINGSDYPGNSVKVERSSEVTLNITADDGYEVSKVIYKDTKETDLYDISKDPAIQKTDVFFKLSDGSLQFKSTITTDTTFTVDIREKTQETAAYSITGLLPSDSTYTVTAKDAAGKDIAITAEGKIEKLADGTKVNLTVTPKEGYMISSITCNGTAVAGAANQQAAYTFAQTLNGKDIEVKITTKAIENYKLTVTQPEKAGTEESGEIRTCLDGASNYEKNATIEAKKGTKISVKVIPNSGYEIAGITVDGKAQQLPANKSREYVFTVTLDANHTVTAVMKKTAETTYSVQFLNNAATAYTVHAKNKTTDDSLNIVSNKITNLTNGTEAEITVTPKPGFYIKQITNNGAVISGSQNQQQSFTFLVKINAQDVKINIEYVQTVTLTIKKPANGTIEAARADATDYVTDNLVIGKGTAIKIKVTPDKNYKIKDVKFGTESQIIKNEREFECTMNLNQDLTVTAVMEAVMYTITANQPENGQILIDGKVPSDGKVTLQEGTKATVTVSANEGSTITSITDNGKDVKVADKNRTSFTYEALDTNHEISAQMEENSYTVTIIGAGCSITADDKALPADGKVTVKHGGNIVLKITADDGKKITCIEEKENKKKLEDNFGGSMEYTVGNVKNDTTVEITTEDKKEGEEDPVPVTYAVTVKQAEGGKITADKTITDGVIKVDIRLSSIAFTIQADAGKIIKDILADGKSVLGDSKGNNSKRTYTLSNIMKDQTFTAVFEDKPKEKYAVTLKTEGEGAVSVKNTDGSDIPFVNGAAELEEGTEIVITAEAAKGYEIAGLTVGGMEIEQDDNSASAKHTVTVTKAMEIKVTFVKETTYVVTVTTEGKGTVTAEGMADGKVTVVKGKDITFTLKPEAGWKVDKILVDNKDTEHAGDTYLLDKVSSDSTIKVIFAEKKAEDVYYRVGLKDTRNGKISADYTVKTGNEKFMIGNEEITVSRSCSVPEGKSITLTFEPDEGYMLDTVKVNNEAMPVSGRTCELPAREDMVIEVTFKKAVLEMLINIELNQPNGGVVSGTPAEVINNTITVDSSFTQEDITIKANVGFAITSVVIDGEEQKITDDTEFVYSFKDFSKNHKVEVTFETKGFSVILDGIGEVTFTADEQGNLTTSANLVPNDSEKPFNGAIFGGWYTEKDGKGTMVIDRSGKVADRAAGVLTSGMTLYIGWQKITLIERQKVNVMEYFEEELQNFQTANPKDAKKYKFVVYTVDSLNQKFAKDTKNKIGTTAKNGIFTAKKAGIARICLATYDRNQKKYVDGQNYIEIAVEKISVKKLNLCYTGETAEAEQIFTYDYADAVGYIPQSGSFDDLKITYSSSKETVVSVDDATGQIRANGFGTAKIKVTYTLSYAENKKAYSVTKSATVMVKAPKFTAAKVTLKTGREKLNRLKNLREGDVVTWSVQNPSVAAVDAEGRVRALQAGSTTVTAHVAYAGGGQEADFTYNVIVK